MRTVRCSSNLPGRGVCPGEGVCPGGVSAQEGCLPRGGGVFPWGRGSAWGCLPRGDLSGGMSAQGWVSAPGGCLSGGCLPRGCLPDNPPWTEWQTGVKTLPCHNYIADGKKDGCRRRPQIIIYISWPFPLHPTAGFVTEKKIYQHLLSYHFCFDK